jgi:predicted nucleic acid-binding protein
MLSELMRPRPEAKVTGWVAAQNIETLFLSVVSIGELETGFTTMLDAQRRARLEASLERHMALLFPGRVLPIEVDPIVWTKNRASLGGVAG